MRNKFCFKVDKTVSETHIKLKEALGDNALHQAQAYDWFQRFEKGLMSVDDEKRS